MDLETNVAQQPIVLVSPSSQNWALPSLKELVRRRINLFDRLHAEGYAVRVPGTLGAKGSDSEYVSVCRSIAHQRPQYFLDVTGAPGGAMHWPRDVFMCYGAQIKTCTIRDHVNYVAPILQELGLASRIFDTSFSGFGEGGCIVSTSTRYIVSDALAHEEAPSVFRSMPYHFLPSPNAGPNGNLERRSATHIDVEVNAHETAQGDFILFANELYYQTFQREVDAFARLTDALLYIVPEEEHALLGVNFACLPDNRVLVPKDSMVTAVLEDHIGKRNVIAHPIEPLYDYGIGGGLRCSSNIIH